MKILHISTSDIGGAGSACVRLHTELLRSGIDSKVLVIDKLSNNSNGIEQFDEYKHQGKFGKGISFFKRHITPTIDEWKLKGKVVGFENFSFPNSMFDITQHPSYKECDIVNLHFITHFLDYKSFFKKNTKPVVWTLHDMNPFTGGCHYSFGCEKFTGDCSDCFQLEGTRNKNYSKIILERKIVAVKTNQKIAIVTPSNWLKNLSQKSRIFSGRPHYVIPHGVDLNLFKAHDKLLARNVFSLPADNKIILFIADDIRRKNKGFDVLLQSMNNIDIPDKCLLCTVGKPDTSIIPLHNHIHLGFINDELLMSLAYSAADITVVPSREESFSLTTLESLACGTPVVAFDSTGPREIITHLETGYMAKPYEPIEIAAGINYLLNDDNRLKEISSKAIKSVAERFDIRQQGRRYLQVYEEMMK